MSCAAGSFLRARRDSKNKKQWPRQPGRQRGRPTSRVSSPSLLAYPHECPPLYSGSRGGRLLSANTSVEVEDFVMAPMMMIGQADEGDPQADQGRDSHEHQDKHERLVHLVQMQENRIPVLVHIFQAGVI